MCEHLALTVSVASTRVVNRLLELLCTPRSVSIVHSYLLLLGIMPSKHSAEIVVSFPNYAYTAQNRQCCVETEFRKAFQF